MSLYRTAATHESHMKVSQKCRELVSYAAKMEFYPIHQFKNIPHIQCSGNHFLERKIVCGYSILSRFVSCGARGDPGLPS